MPTDRHPPSHLPPGPYAIGNGGRVRTRRSVGFRSHTGTFVPLATVASGIDEQTERAVASALLSLPTTDAALSAAAAFLAQLPASDDRDYVLRTVKHALLASRTALARPLPRPEAGETASAIDGPSPPSWPRVPPQEWSTKDAPAAPVARAPFPPAAEADADGGAGDSLPDPAAVLSAFFANPSAVSFRAAS